MEGFDVFSGRIQQGPLWLEFVQTLTDAAERMRERARKHPGPYFVYCCQTKTVVDSIDTSTSAEASAAAGGHGP